MNAEMLISDIKLYFERISEHTEFETSGFPYVIEHYKKFQKYERIPVLKFAKELETNEHKKLMNMRELANYVKNTQHSLQRTRTAFASSLYVKLRDLSVCFALIASSAIAYGMRSFFRTPDQPI